MPCGLNQTIILVFPASLDDLLPETSTGLEHLVNLGTNNKGGTKGTTEPGIVVVYVHPLKTGLYRVCIRGK